MKKRFLFLFILMAAILSVFVFFRFYISAPKDFPANKMISIEKGSSFKEVAEKFKNERLINSAFWFEVYAWFLKKEREVKAGEYFFNEPVNTFELLKNITENGNKGRLIKITIPEGYNLRDIALLFEELGLWQENEFFKITGFPGRDCRSEVCVNEQNEYIAKSSLLSLKPENASMEGFLFPDTYYVSAKIMPEDIIGILLSNFENKITPELREAVAKSGHSFFEILIMASLLEKEASLSEDRRLISGILWKRSQKEMPLQVDAVFPYIIAKNTFELTKNDLKIDSPYNTYLYKGLPLGPIANPGLDSVKAALFPKESPFWYYLSDKEGKIYYSINYEDHLIKKEKYLK